MKNAIVFVDANNWYHNVKKFFEPGQVDILKLAEFLCKVKGYDLIRSHKKEILTAMVPFGYSSELIRNFPFFILRKETLMKCLRGYKDVKGDN